MKFMSRLAKEPGGGGSRNGAVRYDSVFRVESKSVPGVRFAIHRISFGRRMELCRRVRDISRKAAFLEAGNELDEKIEASILAQEIDAMYVEWGLESIEGLSIDGEAAGGAELLAKGPDALAREVVDAIKHECGLSEAERKN